jgi:hypothetical protein
VGLVPSFVLGYHGCKAQRASKILNGSAAFRPSNNFYDWLGNGIYFWEANPRRALSWAQERARSEGRSIKTACVLGAVIDLGHCLDLLSASGLEAVKLAHSSLRKSVKKEGAPKLPRNRGGGDRLNRQLDCAVIEFLHRIRKDAHQQPFDTVRALFREGKPIYSSSGFYEKTHIQVCVRNHACIKGVFRVPADALR